MRERPILFSGEMVRAILAGTKTQTRRVIKPQPDHFHKFSDGILRPQIGHSEIACPYGQPGDRLWVRETHTYVDVVRSLYDSDLVTVDYKADEDRAHVPVEEWIADQVSEWIGDREVDGDGDNWRSPIHMPRWASRITLEITGVRVERLREISDDDAIEEGVDRTNTSIPTYAIQRYRKLWDSINAGRGYSWESNPWVWVVEFKQVQP